MLLGLLFVSAATYGASSATAGGAAGNVTYRGQVAAGHTGAAGLVPGVIFTVAGNGQYGYAGDGGPATAAPLSGASAVAVMPDGGFLIGDGTRVRRVSPTGVISTVAGGNEQGFAGDGGPATKAELASVSSLAVTPDGGFLILDGGNDRVRRVSPDGVISTVAGNGQSGYTGDGGSATATQLAAGGIAAMPDGGFLIADSGNNRVRRVAPDGLISTVAGTGQQGFAGDGGPATSAQLDDPTSVAAMANGGYLIADMRNGRIRRVGPDGVISTVAGNRDGSFGDIGGQVGGQATNVVLSDPAGVAVTPDGGFLISEGNRGRILRVAPDGIISVVAGGHPTSTDPLFLGDGRLANTATIRPYAVAATRDGGFLIADANDRPVFNRIRYVAPGEPALLAIAVHPLGGRATAAGYRLPVVASRASSVEWQLLSRGRKLVGRGTSAAAAGSSTLIVDRRLPTPGVYALRVTARSSTGQVATQTTWAFLGGRLPVKWARAAALGEVLGAVHAADAEEIVTRVGRCQPMSATRVDCPITVIVQQLNEVTSCHNVAVLLGRDGQLYLRSYGGVEGPCRHRKPLQRKPKWTGQPLLALISLEQLSKSRKAPPASTRTAAYSADGSIERGQR